MKFFFKDKACPNCQENNLAVEGSCHKCGATLLEEKENRRFLHDLKLPWLKNMALFFVGWIGLQLIATLAQIIAFTFIPTVKNEAGRTVPKDIPSFNIGVNGISYALVIAFLFLILGISGIKRYGKSFADGKWKAPAFALGGVFALFASGILWGNITGIIAEGIKNAGIDLDYSSNHNQEAINNVLTVYPFLSFIVFGIFGPVSEELTYRGGLYSFLKRISLPLALIITPIIFGLIHFSWDALLAFILKPNDQTLLADLINELLNLPDYISAGVLLCLIYQYAGIGASTSAHLFYNCLALAISIASTQVRIL